MITYAQLRPGRGFQPIRAILYYTQRLATPRPLRRFGSNAIAAGVNLLCPERQPACAPEADHARALVPLMRDGVAILDDLFSAPQLADIMAFLQASGVVGPGGNSVGLDALPPNTRVAAYPLQTALECPHVLARLNSPGVLRLAADYLGCKPTLSSVGIRWSFPGNTPAMDTQNFHRDPDDWRFLKLFVYLTDVDETAGPHVFVAGSHHSRGEIFARPYMPGQLERRYGPASMRTIVGPKGTSFAADTYGIHKGAVPLARPRLLLQAQYSLLPVFAFRYEPVKLQAPSALDRYINRLLVA